MKKVILSTLMITLIATSCKVDKNAGDEQIIGKPELTVSNGQFTPEVMWGLGKMGEYAVSADGKKIAYTVTYYDIAANKGNAEIYVMNADGSDVKQMKRFV